MKPLLHKGLLEGAQPLAQRVARVKPPDPYLATTRGQNKPCRRRTTSTASRAVRHCESSNRQKWTQTANNSCNRYGVAVKGTHMKHPITKLIIIGLIINITLLAVAFKDADAAPIKGLPCPQWHDAMRKAGLPVRVFSWIMARESSCVPSAVGWNYKQGTSHKNCKLSPARTYRKCSAVRSYDVGLLQINSQHRTLTQQICHSSEMLILQKPECNLAVAAALWADGQGGSHWRKTSKASISNN